MTGRDCAPGQVREEWRYPEGADCIVMRDLDGNQFCAIDLPEL